MPQLPRCRPAAAASAEAPLASPTPFLEATLLVSSVPMAGASETPDALTDNGDHTVLAHAQSQDLATECIRDHQSHRRVLAQELDQGPHILARPEARGAGGAREILDMHPD